jgi:hypothetical protein
MNRTLKFLSAAGTAAAFIVLVLAGANSAPKPTANVATDKSSYMAGQTVKITGEGWKQMNRLNWKSTRATAAHHGSAIPPSTPGNIANSKYVADPSGAP